MSAFDEIAIPAAKAAGEAPVTTETPSSETPAAPPALSPEPTQTVEPEKPTGEGASPETSSEQTTEDESKFAFTGSETPEQIQQRGGDSWLVKAGRKALDVSKQAGGFQNLKHGAELISMALDQEQKGIGLLQKIAAISPTRAKEIREDIIWDAFDFEGNHEIFLKDILKDPNVTLAEVKQALEAQRNETQDLAEPDPADEFASLPPALKKELEELRSLKTQFPELQTKVRSFENSREKDDVTKLGQELYQSVFSVVEERKKKLGLEVHPTDSEEVKDIKQDLQSLLSDESVEQAFMSNEDNARISDRAIAYVKKRDKSGAFAYRDTLSVAAEVAFEQMLRDGRISRKLAQLKSVMESQSKPKDPTSRPEIVAGSPAGFSGPDPFDDGIKEGKTPFEVARELAGRGRAAATR